MVQQKDKSLSRTENRVYKEYNKNGKPEALYYLDQNLTSEISSYISKCKNDYFICLGKELSNPSKSLNTDCVTLKTLWIEKNIPLPYS